MRILPHGPQLMVIVLKNTTITIIIKKWCIVIIIIPVIRSTIARCANNIFGWMQGFGDLELNYRVASK